MAAAAAAAAALGLALGLAAALRLRRPPAPPRAPPRAPFTARLVAHRGGCGERIENTMEAFANAVAQGADLLELDARRTRDGVVVVSHDGDLRRQAGLARDLRRLDYQDLPPYKDPLEVTFSPGCFAHGSDRRVPRLEEVFERFPRVPVSVEIKDDDDELIRQVAELVQRHDRAAITVWASFEERILRKCRAANPAMPYGFSLRRGLLLLLLYYTGLLPFVPLGESFLLFLLPSIINRCRTPGPAGGAGRLGPFWDVFPGASGLPRAAAGQNGGESHHEEETAPTPQRQRDPGGAVGAERGAGLRRGLRPRGLGRHDRLPHAAAALPGRPPAPLSPDAWVPPGPGRLGPWLHPDTWVPHGARTPGSLVAGTQHPCSTQSPGETRNHVGTKGAGRPQNGPIPPRNGGVTLPAAARGPPMEPPNKSRLRRAAGDFSCPDAWAPAWGREQL